MRLGNNWGQITIFCVSREGVNVTAAHPEKQHKIDFLCFFLIIFSVCRYRLPVRPRVLAFT